MPEGRPVVCPRCGQRGNERPGLKLGDYEGLQAVFVGDELVPGFTPQRIVCQSCWHSWPVARGSVEIRK
jgi:hypothetical protein